MEKETHIYTQTLRHSASYTQKKTIQTHGLRYKQTHIHMTDGHKHTYTLIYSDSQTYYDTVTDTHIYTPTPTYSQTYIH